MQDASGPAALLEAPALTTLPLEAFAFATAKLLPTTLLVPTFAPVGGRAQRAALALLLAFGLATTATERPFHGPFGGIGGLAGLLLAALGGLPVALVARTVLVAASGSFSLGDSLAGFAPSSGPGAGRGPFAELAAVLAGYIYFASGAVARTLDFLGASDRSFPGLGLWKHLPATLVAGIGLAATFAAPWLFARLFCDLLLALAAKVSDGVVDRLGDFGFRRGIATLFAAVLLGELAVRLAPLLAP